MDSVDFCGQGSDSVRLFVYAEFVLAMVNRPDVICVDTLDRDTPANETIGSFFLIKTFEIDFGKSETYSKFGK